HPWNGIARHDINPIRAEDIVRRVHRVSEVAADGEAVLRQVSAVTSVGVNTAEQLAQVAAVRLVTKPEPSAADDVIAHLADPQLLAAMERFAEDLSEHAALQADVTAAFDSPTHAEQCSPNDLRRIAEGYLEAGFGDGK